MFYIVRHGPLLYLYGFCIDICIFPARYLRWWNLHILLHTLLMLALYGLTIWRSYSVLTRFKGKEDGNSEVGLSHYIMGMMMLCLITLQVIAGFLHWIYLSSFKIKNAKLIGLFRKSHFYLGYFFYIFSKIELLTGLCTIYLYYAPKYVTNGIILGIIIITVMSLINTFVELMNKSNYFQLKMIFN